MINYKVIWDKNKTRLEQKIIDDLNNGWQLSGGVAMTAIPSPDREGKIQTVLVWGQALLKMG
jgi:hypothetical protein